MLTVFLHIPLLYVIIVIVVACLSFCLICLAYQRVLLIADNSRFLFACTVIIIGFRVVVVFVRVCWWL